MWYPTLTKVENEMGEIDYPPAVDCIGCNDEGIVDRETCGLCERGRKQQELLNVVEIIADAVAWSQGRAREDKHICNAEDVITRLEEHGFVIASSPVRE